MASLATLDDLQAVWPQSLSSGQASLAERLLLVASAIVRRRVPAVDTRITAETLDAVLTATVVANMVKRVMASSDGVVSESVAGYSVTYDASRMSTALALTAEEILLLGPASSSRRVGSIRLAAGLNTGYSYGGGRPYDTETR